MIHIAIVLAALVLAIGFPLAWYVLAMRKTVADMLSTAFGDPPP